MKMQTKEFAKLTGVSVRTLHFYDEIGLLKPSHVDEQTGYRFYDERSLERMQEILFYRELDFPLKDIAKILTSPDYDKQKALKEQRHLLTLKKERLERLITALECAVKGDDTMNIQVFDNSEFEAAREEYAREARERWGSTDAYRESAEKTADYTKDKWVALQKEMDDLLEAFAACKNRGAAALDASAQKLVEQWQAFITEHYYICTKEILAGLGQMYVADERFRKNMDRHGEGTAAFMSEAIAVYCA